MTPDEARAELAAMADVWWTTPNGRSDEDFVEWILARPELVLAALGAEQVGWRSPIQNGWALHGTQEWPLQGRSWRPVFVLPEGTEKP